MCVGCLNAKVIDWMRIHVSTSTSCRGCPFFGRLIARFTTVPRSARKSFSLDDQTALLCILFPLDDGEPDYMSIDWQDNRGLLIGSRPARHFEVVDERARRIGVRRRVNARANSASARLETLDTARLGALNGACLQRLAATFDTEL